MKILRCSNKKMKFVHFEVHKQTINVNFVQFLEMVVSLKLDQQRSRIPLDLFFAWFCNKIVGEVWSRDMLRKIVFIEPKKHYLLAFWQHVCIITDAISTKTWRQILWWSLPLHTIFFFSADTPALPPLSLPFDPPPEIPPASYLIINERSLSS